VLLSADSGSRQEKAHQLAGGLLALSVHGAAGRRPDHVVILPKDFGKFSTLDDTWMFAHRLILFFVIRDDLGIENFPCRKDEVLRAHLPSANVTIMPLSVTSADTMPGAVGAFMDIG